MTKQFTILRTGPLEQAIQIIIDDRRTPAELRKALAVHRDQWRYMTNLESAVPKATQAEPSYMLKLVHSNVAEASTSWVAQDAEGSCTPNLPFPLKQGMNVIITLNNAALDWSVEINGVLIEHVTSEIMEVLLECAIIKAQLSLTGSCETRLQ